MDASDADTMTCRELSEAITDYLEGAPPFGRRVRVCMHLVACASCRAYRKQVEQTAMLLRNLPGGDLVDDAGLALARGAFVDRNGSMVVPLHPPQQSLWNRLQLRLSFGSGLAVGIILVAVNHAACLWRGTFDHACALQSGATVVIPVAVTMLASVWSEVRLKS